MNEYPPAVQDTPIRDLAYYDPDRQEYPRIPAILLFDEEGRKTRPIGFPIFTGTDCEEYQWSKDNLTEVDRGWIHRAASVEDLAGQLNIPLEQLRHTLDRWNTFCDKKVDEEKKGRRLAEIQNTQKAITLKKNKSLEGTVQEILVEGWSKKGGQMSGRTGTNKIVNFNCNNKVIGSLVNVKIQRSFVNSLRGECL